MKDRKTVKWIFNKTKKQCFSIFILNILNIVYSALSIYLIMVSKYVIDSATTGKIDELKYNIIKLVVISLVEIALRAIILGINAISRAKLEINMKQDVLKTIISKNYEKISEYHSGELMTRITFDVNIIIDTIFSLIPNILALVTKLICATWLLYKISPKFVAVLLLGGIVLFIVVNLFKPYMKKIHKRLQEAGSTVRLFFKEIFDSIVVIKIFGAEKEIAEKSKELQKKRYGIQMKRRNLSILSSTGFNTIFQIVYLYALIWSTYNLYLGKITVGSLTSIVQLIIQIQSPIIELSRSFQNIFGMLASAERIIELEQIEDDNISKKLDRKDLYRNLKSIKLENIDFKYKDKYVLENANLEVKKGEIVAIYGESGAGKSTLLKLILGIIKKNNGEAYFEMNNGKKVNIDTDTRAMFSYVPQGQFIFSGSVKENITFINNEISKEKLDKALEVSCAKEFISQMQNGIETKIGERGKGLSEGQLQRLAIARAIVNEAPILILDEITSSLDSETEMKVLNNIKKLKDYTCIIVTHRKSVSSICDREFIVEDNKIKECDK